MLLLQRPRLDATVVLLKDELRSLAAKRLDSEKSLFRLFVCFALGALSGAFDLCRVELGV
jgi:hypothetical protein